MKRLVVCCDGTWNKPDQRSGGELEPTNVARLSEAVAASGTDGVAQRRFYHPGVGTRPGEKFRGGAFGFGLSRDIRDAYTWVVENFEPGDELFVLGFSRGAYTARSLVGLIRNSGVLRPEHAGRVAEAFALYRSRGNPPASAEAQQFRDAYSHETRIRFIGVWDTVGALGIPLRIPVISWLVNRNNQFHDVALSSTVDAAFQALAIDEQRSPFRPAVWQPKSGASAQELQQVWFAGCHCDVGGGNRVHGLSDIALLWIAEHAGRLGLGLDRAALRAGPRPGSGGTPNPIDPNPLSRINESRTSCYRLLPPYHRPIDGTRAAHETVSASAEQRFAELGDYRPPELVEYRRTHPDAEPTPVPEN